MHAFKMRQRGRWANPSDHLGLIAVGRMPTSTPPSILTLKARCPARPAHRRIRPRGLDSGLEWSPLRSSSALALRLHHAS
jgi:hypothetical protein